MPPLPADRRSEMADGVFFEAKSRIARAAAIPLRLCVSAVKQNTLAPSRPRGNHPITDQQLQSTAPHFRKRNRKHKRKAALRTLSTNCYFLSPVKRNAAAFSLTEVVIALGIFAVSMVGVLALFPVASSTGRESSEETQAAILAETIISDLRTSTSAKGRSFGWIVRGPNTFNASQWLRPVSLTNDSTNFVVYDLIPRVNSSGPDGVGMIGQPIALKAIFTNLTATTYSNAINSTGAVFGSRIAIQPLTNLPGMALVTVTVDSPVSANSTNRRNYQFSSVLSAP
jgi:Tfp pilus assembly protein PilV